MGKYQYMNLEQKLAKIRKKMPLLLKNIIMTRQTMILPRWMISMHP